MKITIIGTGYVGLVTGTCFAEVGHTVICVDNDEAKVRMLQGGGIPIYEPGLEDMVKSNVAAGRLNFTASTAEGVEKSDVIFIAVPTPPLADGGVDLSFIERVARDIAGAMTSYKIIVDKSTVPVKTGEKVSETIKRYCKAKVEFDVISNPEFLREGFAVDDLMHPDRVVVGVATQAIALYDLLSGEENLRFFGEVYGLSGTVLAKRVAWCLDFVGLTDRKDDAIAGYSGGMKRRLNLAAALVHDPQLLLLDEPTVGVDPQSRNKIFENIEALHAEGRTIIYTTHYMEEAVRLCERIAIIDAGRLLALGTVAELLATHGGPPTLVVRTNGEERRLQTADPLAELNRMAATGTIDAFQMERPTLEQVFLSLTGRSLRD